MTKRHTRSTAREHAGSSADDGPSVGRRSYLKLAGTAVGSVPLATNATGTASGTSTVGANDATDETVGEPMNGASGFSRTVDAVAAGCDPTGERTCDRAFRRAVANGGLVRFPAGTYRFSRPQVVLGVESVGVVGDGDVTFVVDPGFEGNLLTVAGGSRLSFAGIDIDMTAPSAIAGLRLCARDSLRIENVTVRGRTRERPTDHPVANVLSPVVRSPDGTGIVRNVVARDGGPVGPAHRRPDGRAGIRVGSATRGTVTIADCDLEGFPAGGVYASETSGTVRIEGGRYRDNDVAGIRLGANGAVENARIVAGFETDPATDPPVSGLLASGSAADPSASGSTAACGVRLEGGGSGATIAGCDVRVGPDAGGEGAVVAAHDHGGFALRDSRIRVRKADLPAVCGFDPRTGRYSPPRDSLGTRIENCAITGSGDGPSVRLVGRPAPRLERCLVDGFVYDARASSPPDHTPDGR
jgi:hypothetical protein